MRYVYADFLRKLFCIISIVCLSFTYVIVACGCNSRQPEEEQYSISIQMQDGTIHTIELEQYLIGVVLAEMPTDFEIDALKAQAVVARTFAWKNHVSGGKHFSCDLCTNPSCCQGYLSEREFLERNGSAHALLKVMCAVRDTESIIITYADEPIEATYFSCSGGYTEDAEEVWGNAYPYLTAKISPGEEKAFCYEDTKTFSLHEFCDLLSLEVPGTGDLYFTDWEYTQGGGVASVSISNIKFYGTELRKLLGLRSTDFCVDFSGDSIQFTTRGYGHRVGMSQYGADAMAVAGKRYDEILGYYFNDTKLKRIFELRKYD